MVRISFAVYGTMTALLIGLGAWLVVDLADGRERILFERSELAAQKSQFMSQWFGTTIVAADYVLRDINDKVPSDGLGGRVQDPRYFGWLTEWLEKKRLTVPGVVSLGVYDGNCIYRASASSQFLDVRSSQSFCEDTATPMEDRRYVQYVPVEKSVNKMPSLLISRQQLSPEGRLLGGAMMAIHLSAAQKWIMDFPIDPGDFLAIVDGDGILMAHNPPRSEAIGTLFQTAALQSDYGDGRFTTSYIDVSPNDGRQIIYGLSKIEDVPMVVLVGYDLHRNLAEWRHRAWQISAGYLALLVVTAVAARAHLIALRQREEMRTLAATDPLTGVANRRQLVQTGESEVSRALRYGRRISVIMVDIDRFKSVNDTWGHPAGDRVIQAVAQAMAASIRGLDRVGRLGGEEFAAILPEADRPGAQTIAERLRETVQNMVATTSDDGTTVHVTVSAGVATLSPDDKDFATLLNRADKALYDAKVGGRNRVVAL